MKVELTEDTILVPAEPLKAFARRALDAVGVPADHAATIADTLVEADLRGIYSHGTLALPRYVRGMRAGNVSTRPNVRTIGGRGPIAIYDGDNCLGSVVGVKAMASAIENARDFGVGIAVARNSNHFGAAGYYAMMALPHKMIGFATTNAPGVMAPWGSRDVILGNNPVAWAVPALEEEPLVLDMACTAVARGKLRVAIARGKRIPLGWATDPEGQPTDDPEVGLRGMLEPAGTYKGSGLALVMEAISGVLPGANFLTSLPVASKLDGSCQSSWGIGHFFMAIDVSVFLPPAEFGQRIDRLIRDVRNSTPIKGCDRIYVPGEIEYLNKVRQLAEGIPFPTTTVGDLRRLAGDLGVAFELA